MAWLLLAHAVALAAWAWWIVRYEVPLNARMIDANGAADDLHAGFHTRRFNVRALVAAPLALVGSAPALLAGALPYVCAVVALLVLLAAVFVRTFNPLLNVARKLAYVPRFYVSQSPTASLFDRLLSRWPLQTVLNLALAGGILLYLALLATGFYWLKA